jgi:hypothetical protein
MPEATSESNVMQDFDTEFLMHAPEIYIFSACRHIIELILAAQGSLNAGEIDAARFGERVNPLFTQLQDLADATHRFDIIVPLGLASTWSAFFWRWFNWWYDYRQSLTPEELDRIHRLQDTFDPAALDYRPAGDWLTYRATLPSGLSPTMQERASISPQMDTDRH